MAALLEEPENDRLLSELLLLVEAQALLPLEVNLWQAQNMYWTMLQSRASDLRSDEGGTGERRTWSETVKNLGQLLFFNVPAVLAAAKGDL